MISINNREYNININLNEIISKFYDNCEQNPILHAIVKTSLHREMLVSFSFSFTE